MTEPIRGREHTFRASTSPTTLLTLNRRGHWAKDDNLRAAWRAKGERLGRGIAMRYGPMEAPVRVVVWLYWPDRRRRDTGNYALTGKAIVDGLVDGGLIPDDNDARVLGPDMRRLWPDEIPPNTLQHLRVVVYEANHEALTSRPGMRERRTT